MKDLFAILAEYNAHANRLLFGVLQAAPPELITKDVGSYFGSILGLLNHVLRSDLVWLSRFRASPLALRSLEAPEAAFDPATAPRLLYTSLGGLEGRRRGVDGVFVALADELDGEKLRTRVSYTNHRGEQESFVLAELLLHVFNHQTHHRGQVSQILDAAGIEHDFSNVTAVLRARKHGGLDTAGTTSS